MNVNKLLNLAAGEIGTTESPPNSNNVKYNTWYYRQPVHDGLWNTTFAWCMAFVQWCFHQAGLTLPYKTASCNGLLGWYKQNDPERIVAEPKPGDIVIYNFSHTGIVERADANSITAIEGNTSASTAGSQSNGGGVFRKTRGKAQVKAYIRPFDFDENDENKEDEDMTMEKFKEFWRELREELQDNDSGDWSKEARDWAVRTGLINGNGTTINGEPNCMWADFLTREQLVAVLYRFAQMLGKA